MKKLPIGLDNFEDFPLLNSVYVDKTQYIYKMMSAGGKSFFLSRPRRFGKSLLLSTIKAIFEGKRELFAGLYIEDKINWETYPVIKLDMSLNATDSDSLKEGLQTQLRLISAQHGITIPSSDPTAQLAELIGLLALQSGKQVVVLVDEYDKPILDAIQDLQRANEIREMLSSFYTVLKASASMIRFLMVTGITKISQTSIFSGFNNLNDISLDSPFAGICGYTQQELETQFDGYIRNLAARKGNDVTSVLADLKYWYNGYSWDGITFVYNPYSVLLLLDKGNYKPFWYSTRTPTFLLKLLKSGANLETVLKKVIRVPDTFTDGQSIERLDSIGLLFQAGYLTISNYHENQSSYDLQLPNEEVKRALSELVLTDIYPGNSSQLHELSKNIKDGFAAGNTGKAIESLDILLSNTTYNTHQPNQNESHYQSLFQLAMILSNIDHRNESIHRDGRTDAVLLFDSHVYIIEIKYAGTPEKVADALSAGFNQIQENKYYKPYAQQGRILHLLSLAFTKHGIEYREEVI